MRYVFKTKEPTVYRFPTHANALVMDRSEATASEVFISVMESGEAPPLHQHDDTEQVFYVLSGRGRLEVGHDGASEEVEPGDVVRIPPSTPHRVWCVSDDDLRYLVVDCFPGGRPSAEPTWDDHVRTICAEHGWAFDDVVERPRGDG